MVDVFEQVEEELRSDRYKRLAFTWLPVVGGILLVALIAALSWWGWTSYQSGRADKASVAYDRGLEALQANNPAGAEAAFAEAQKEGNGAYKALALQQRAGLAETQNRVPEAIALFDEAAKATRSPVLGDPARLKAAYLLMDNNGALADIETRLTPLTEEDRPLRAFAQLALGMARLQHGKTAEARSAFVLVSLGQDASDDLRQQAQLAISAIETGAASNLGDILKVQAALPPQAPAAATAPGQMPAEAPAQLPAQAQ